MSIFIVMLLVVVAPIIGCNGKLDSGKKAGFFVVIGVGAIVCWLLSVLFG